MKKTFPRILLASLACVCLASNINARAAMAIDSLTGPITANEITAFKSYMATRTIATNNAGNVWLFGSSGQECGAIGRMYEATGDTAILDRMIQYADTILAGRNNTNTGVVMWTGKRELCWPNSFTAPVYTSCESGEVAGHILDCARLILLTPAIWTTTVAVGDPRGYGATYKARALTYLTECDKTIDTFIIPIWVSAANGNHIYAPANWNGDGGANGGPVAWNRISMFLAALQHSSECHEILGDAPSRVTSQDAIVQSNVQWFLSKAVPYTKSGFSCYNWFYRADTTSKYEEVWEDHGALDIRMLWQSYDRGIGISKAEMTKFANTMQYSVWTGSVFHGQFDGTDGSYGTHSYTKGEYIDLAEFVPAVYTTVATPDQSHTTDPAMISSILWMKQRRYLDSSIWEIQNVTSGKVLNQGGSTTNGSPISQWTVGTSDNLKFTFIPTPGGYYQINSVKSGRDVVVSGASTANGANLVQWSLGSSGNDQWKPVQNSDGTWTFFNLNSGKVINNTAGSLLNGTQYSQWSAGTSDNLKFNLLPQ